MTTSNPPSPELKRLDDDTNRVANWKRWGTYLAERQWGTVREDYSPDGTCWDYLPHDHARSRAYRWGEDGLLGLTDRECRLCFALCLWNGKDPILKERLFGLTGPEGNHGEDVKELYYYLDALPTHAYARALYKYPQDAYPYADLLTENRRRGRSEGEYEIIDTGVFDQGRYHDVQVEYAKSTPDDILIRITVTNHADAPSTLHLLPNLWFRNTWTWGSASDRTRIKPSLTLQGDGSLLAEHETLGPMILAHEDLPGAARAQTILTENETNSHRLFGTADTGAYVKDAFHAFVIDGRSEAVNPAGTGTKAAVVYRLDLPARGQVSVRLRLSARGLGITAPFDEGFDRILSLRRDECDGFYNCLFTAGMGLNERAVCRQAYAGLLWSKQFYHYVVRDWLDGDPGQPPPPQSRLTGRNHEWTHIYNRDVISMPDDWEYPWYAAWDLAFHTIPLSRIDPRFAKDQLLLFLREWYMHPNGQLPAYEFALDDVNPPVHAWAALKIYHLTKVDGVGDIDFLERVFQKLLLNFTWWVNRKDIGGKNLFAGGFLGLDNIGVFDRSKPLPSGGYLEQADGTAWMAFFAAKMLAIALELAKTRIVYEDIASKFFEHFVAIVDAMNTLGGSGLWDEQDGFYYDQLTIGGETTPLRVRSLVGIIALIAVEVIDEGDNRKCEGFNKRTRWFLENRKDLKHSISYLELGGPAGAQMRLLAVPSRDRLRRVLGRLLDEREFLSPHGIRSLSRVYCDQPYSLRIDGEEYRVAYAPGESDTGLFGGNSNWRGPIWFPINYLLIQALRRYHAFYGGDFTIECPTGSGRLCHLGQVADDLARRLSLIFLPDAAGHRPCHGGDPRYAEDPAWRDLVLFYEYFHGDNGRGVGASHQTGWTALVAMCLEQLA